MSKLKVDEYKKDHFQLHMIDIPILDEILGFTPLGEVKKDLGRWVFIQEENRVLDTYDVKMISEFMITLENKKSSRGAGK